MKLSLAIASCFISILSFSQEINLGGGIGTDKGFNSIGLHSYLEYRPENAQFSINMDASYHAAESDSFLTIPVYLKLIFGNKFRVCPSIGGFVRSNSNTGWITNMNLEFLINEKTIITAQGSLTTDYWKANRVSPGGIPYVSTENSKWLWFNIGIKKTLSSMEKSAPLTQ